MFTEIDKLKFILDKIYQNNLSAFVDNWIANIDSDLANYRSETFQKLNESFEGQKNNRQTLCRTPLVFNLILSEWIDARAQNSNCCSQYMNKYLIDKFIKDLEDFVGRNIIIDTTRNQKFDEIVSKLFLLYIDAIDDPSHYPQEFINLINELSIQ